MATRSRIGILENDGSVTSIYCHWNGYISHNGRILREHYKTEEKVRELISLGDLSSLGEKIGTKHDFNDRPDKECNFYGRDRGETDVGSRNTSLEEFANQEEYHYLFDPKTGTWSCYADGDLLTEAQWEEGLAE